MITICSNCHRLIALAPVDPGIVSHGICLDCVEKVYGSAMATYVRQQMDLPTLREIRAGRPTR